MEPYNWTCPHCERAVTITAPSHSENSHTKWINEFELISLVTTFVTCPNPDCNKIAIAAELLDGHSGDGYETHFNTETSRKWNLIPGSKAKAFPDYIPAPIIDDYTEACLIADLSPKASATLSRRCLQGMIRDFWSVKEKNLFQEIKAIEDKLDPETFSAIDAVRSIGNIGAHMEKDIDLILDVEPHEAELLINLIETLIREWYVSREVRRVRMAAIVSTAEAKKELKVELKAVDKSS